ncbi:MAG TPA: glutathione S-transferase N-terminal domain-containing protein [Steroidobacteraceae bacterium]|nr:glutathione S-transferase N-terminal domain-containing protein [Steroidobacteraceae bacterium]
MKLYYLPGACSLATHIVLEWVGAPYETVKMERAALKSPEYLALNPNGAVPVLVDGDFVLTQNLAILCYLAERYPDARLLGDGTARGRAELMRWLGFLNSDVHPAFKPIFGPARFHPDPAAAPILAENARAQVRKHLEQLDRRLRGREWLVDGRSIADPYSFVMLRWARRLGIDSSGLDGLTQFFDRMQADRGVRAALTAEEGAPQ